MRLVTVVEKIVTALFLLLGIGVLVKVSDFPYPIFKNIGSSPGIFPWLLGFLLISLSSLVLILNIISSVRTKKTEADVSDFKSAKPVATIVLSIIYTLLLPYIGYLLGTVLWMFSLFLVFKPKSRIIFALTFAALIGVTYLVYWFYLPVRLPAGLLFD